MDAEYIKKLQAMKLSDAVKEIWGIELLPHQKVVVDSVGKDNPIKIINKDSVKVSMVDDSTFEITKKLTPMESEALFKDLFGTTDVGILNCGDMSDEEFNRIIDELNKTDN